MQSAYTLRFVTFGSLGTRRSVDAKLASREGTPFVTNNRNLERLPVYINCSTVIIMCGARRLSIVLRDDEEARDAFVDCLASTEIKGRSSQFEDLNERNYRTAPFILQVIKIPDNQ